MESVLFVCLGNICRSPLAEGIASAYAPHMHFDSAGTGNWHVGEPPCAHSIEVAARHGIDIASLRARQISREDGERFGWIVALDASNARAIRAMGIENVVMLGDFGFGGEDVPDPYFFEGFEGFESVFGMIEEAVKHLLDHLATQS